MSMFRDMVSKIVRSVFYLSLFFFCGVFTCSCTKSLPDTGLEESGEEIVLGVEGDGVDVLFDTDTKATEVTSLASTTVYWGATTGGNAAGSGTETSKWTAASASVGSNSKFSTGKKQTATATAYNYYVSNADFTIGASTSMTVENNNTDIVAGRLFGNNTTTPKVTCEHIFARLCNVTTQAATGYSISAIAVLITPKVSGTYNLRTQSWTASNNGSQTIISNTAIGTKSNDIYLVPGDYTVTLSWTASIGNYTKTFTNVSKTVTLQKGKKNNLTITLGGDATAVTFTTSVTAFTDVNGGTLNMN